MSPTVEDSTRDTLSPAAGPFVEEPHTPEEDTGTTTANETVRCHSINGELRFSVATKLLTAIFRSHPVVQSTL